MCGSTAAQNASQQQSAALQNAMLQNYQTEFGEASSIFSELSQSLSPIVEAGPNQQGFSASELAAMNTQAIQQAGSTYSNEMQAANESAAAKGGGTQLTPSGAASQVQESIGLGSENQEATALNQITQENYKQGTQNYENAVGALSGVGNVFSSATSAGSAAAGAGQVAGSEANAIEQADNSWMGLVGGVLGNAASAFSAYEGA